MCPSGELPTVGHFAGRSICTLKALFFLPAVEMAGVVFPGISVRVLQRSIIWWLWWTQDKPASEIHLELWYVFGNEAYFVQTVRTWLRPFRGSRDRVQDLERSGRPMSACCEENVEAVVDAVNQDQTQRVTDIALRVQLSHSSVHRILRGDLNYFKKTA